MLVNVENIRRRVEAEGFVTPPDNEATLRLAFGLRLTPVFCMTWAATGMILASPLILWALVPFAVLGVILPNHPFDVIYNTGVRHLIGGMPLPRYPFYRHVVCATASIMLLISGWGFFAGLPAVGYTFSAFLVSSALLYITTGYCVVSFLFNHKFYMQQLAQ